MIEVLGPSLARAVVGDDYDPDFKYELETDESGMRVIITNTEDGSSTVKELEDTLVDEGYHPEPIWNLNSITNTSVSSKQKTNLILAIITATLICIVLYLIVR